MRFRVKLVIFFVAIFVSVLGFHLISSPFVGLYTMAKKTGNENIENSLSECDDDTNKTHQITGKPFQTTHLSPSYCYPRVKRTTGASK